MDPVLARRIAVPLLAVLACFLGWQIASGSFVFAGLLAGVVLVGTLSWLAKLETSLLFSGAVLIGYLVGNRGFAQLGVPGLPIFPGEVALALALVTTTLGCALSKRLPFRRDLLNLFILLWILLAAARIRTDLRNNGAVALRDFAMIYYALFFFVAQEWARSEASARWIVSCLRVGLALAAPAFILFFLKTDWLVSHITLAGVPVIYVKSDVAGGFMVAALLVACERYRSTRSFKWIGVAVFSLAGLALSNSRAAFVALAASCLWLLIFKHTRLLRLIFVLCSVAIVVLAIPALFSKKPFEQTELYRYAEAGVSIVDLDGSLNYQSERSADKPDNNRFRMTWWTTVVRQTSNEAPWLGLGFGTDLSDEFQKTYFPEGAADFSARSPHNIFVTTYGRMGLAGLSLLVAVFGCLFVKVKRAGQRAVEDDANIEPFVWWLSAWAIFITALFGVVLESPMGAVPFWVILGFANGLAHEAKQENA